MIPHTLLLTAILSTLSGEVESREDSRTLFLPSPQPGVEYHNVEAWTKDSRLYVQQLSPNSWKVHTKANSIRFQLTVCDDGAGLCTPTTFEWGAEPYEMPLWLYLGISILGGIALGAGLQGMCLWWNPS